MKKVVSVLIVLLVLLCIPFITVQAKTLGDLRNELEAAQKKLNDTNVKKALNKQSLNETNQKINNIKAQVATVEAEIEAKTKESEELEIKIVKKNEEIKSLMRYYQVSSSNSAMLEYIMGAKSLTDLIYRLSVVEQISNYNERAIKEMNDMIIANEEAKKVLAQKKEELLALKSDLDVQAAILSQRRSELDREGQSDAAAVKDMLAQVNYYKNLGCSETESINACYTRIKGNNYLPPGTTFYRPTTTGRITSEFGNRILNGSPNKHFAIDIGMATGTTVYSVAPGIVGATGQICGYSIVVWHNINGKSYSSLYCHLSKILVSKGQVVTKDTVIAKSGCTGKCYGAHLHLGLATGRYQDEYYLYYGNNSFESHTFNPRNVITFPPLGSSYSNR